MRFMQVILTFLIIGCKALQGASNIDLTVKDINAGIEEIAREFNRDAEVIKSAIDEIDEEIHIGLVRFWGQKCVLSVQCLHFYLGTHLVQVSVCDRGTSLTGVDGSCKPSPMVWVLLAVLLLIVSSCSVICYYSRQRRRQSRILDRV